MIDDKLTLFIDPGNAPVELITEIFLKLDAISRSLGGNGLEIYSRGIRNGIDCIDLYPRASGDEIEVEINDYFR